LSEEQEIQTIMDEIKATLYDEATDTPKFDPQAALLDTSYFTDMVKAFTRILPKLKQAYIYFRQLALAVDTLQNTTIPNAKGRMNDLEQDIIDLNTYVQGLEARITALEGA
jgi:hypothetical protein